ncbi:MAG TPA: hypothetical protein VFU21_09500 [Kofleriaceae bacterium]|nr:hypothetical protein [Kofleriaceae bacterium]
MQAAPSRRSTVALALCVSFIAHGVAASAIVLLSSDRDEEEEIDPFSVVDVDVAPEAPEGFDPADDVPAAQVVEEVAPPPARNQPEETQLEPSEEDRPAEEEPAEKTAELIPHDAGPTNDAGAPDGGTAIAGTGAPDGGPEVAGAANDAGAPGTAPAATATASRPSAPPGPPGTAADFRPYVPQGDKVTVLLRYDRLRGTPWAKLADAILAPMPDYRAIVGSRNTPLADLFDVLLISSRNPTDVTATNLVARTRRSPAEMRRFLAGKDTPVKWRAARGGVLGKRLPSPSKLERDNRVYLIPFPEWIVLTRTKHLGELAREAPAPGAPADLDAVRADETALPDWLRRARSVEVESGLERGPIAVMSVSGIKHTEIDLPQVGTVPVPVHAALAIEMAKQGFYVRGTLTFSTVERAQAFQRTLEAARSRLLDSTWGQLLLKNFHAYHGLKGLTMRRRDARVTYATSISIADGKAMMVLAADWARRFYAAQEEGEHEVEGGDEATPGGGAKTAPAKPAGGKPR